MSDARFATKREQLASLTALDHIQGALRHLATQYSAKMTREEAMSHFQARALLVDASNDILQSYGRGFLRGKTEVR